MEVKISAELVVALKLISSLEGKTIEDLISGICQEYIGSYAEKTRNDEFNLEPEGNASPLEKFVAEGEGGALMPVNAALLKAERRARGFNQADMARMAGVTGSTISGWERGGHARLSLLQKLAAALELPVEKLIRMK